MLPVIFSIPSVRKVAKPLFKVCAPSERLLVPDLNCVIAFWISRLAETSFERPLLRSEAPRELSLEAPDCSCPAPSETLLEPWEIAFTAPTTVVGSEGLF